MTGKQASLRKALTGSDSRKEEVRAILGGNAARIFKL